MAPTTRAIKVNPGGTVPVRFMFYPSDGDRLLGLLDLLRSRGIARAPSGGKLVRLALRELAKRSPEEIESLLAEMPSQQ